MTKIPEVNFSSNASVTLDDIMENSNSCDTNNKMTNFSIAAIMNMLGRPRALDSTKLGKKIYFFKKSFLP